MLKIRLRKIKISDKKYFAKWWIDEELIKLTSGILTVISDKEVDKYFKAILQNKIDYHFVIMADKNVIGHISLTKRRSWFEIQIVIGEKKYWGKGYGAEAIRLLLKKAKKFNISKIYLEVRPNNSSAIHAYENCGFKKVKTISYSKNKDLPKVLRMELK